MLGKVKYALCKTMAKHLSNKNVVKTAEVSQIKDKSAAVGQINAGNSKNVKFDNVFDLVFNSNSMAPKQSASKHVSIMDKSSEKARLNFLGNDNLKIVEKGEDTINEFDLSKVKLSK